MLAHWNCRHLANANKFGHIRRVNTMLGLFIPALVTPLELLGGIDEEKQMSDPPIDEIREIRHRISECFGHDPERLVAYYMELQEKYRDRFVDAPRKEPDDRSAT
ncbi:MAG TPA: hypothetical protein VGX68_07375 [Thermoanaerobaculia bacterium]|nr:hypothetical protein [Thermoanaerobaculia bacterium]